MTPVDVGIVIAVAVFIALCVFSAVIVLGIISGGGGDE